MSKLVEQNAHIVSTLLGKQHTAWVLVGTIFGDRCCVVDAIPSTGLLPTSAFSARDLLVASLPYGLQVVGLASSLEHTSDATQQAQQLLECLSPAWASDAASLVLCNIADGQLNYTTVNGGAVKQATSDTPDSERRVPVGSVLVRVTCKVDLPVYAPLQQSMASDAGAWHQALQLAQAQLLQQLEAGRALLLVSHSGTEQTLVSPSTEGEVASLTQGSQGVLATTVLMQDARPPTPTPEAPVLRYQPTAVDSAAVLIQVALDLVAYVPENLPLKLLAATAVLPAMQRQLAAAIEAVAARCKPFTQVSVRPRHYTPPGLAHHLTLLYTHHSRDEASVEASHSDLRAALHHLFGLPTNRPLLRLSNAVALDEGGGGRAEGGPEAGKQLRLVNVHEGLTPPIPGGAVSMVAGRYWYHHYLQDRCSDSGWGCAYRSLQTLCSWFVLQHYTSKPIPSHREIQEVLVRLGDKEASFLGSSSWIGAIELGYVLDEYLGVSCKVITVNRGSDIPSYARQLAHHFATQGTPVMIGGGVLAYTLLGVQFDESTGEAAFLILDPHYTGGEDLKKIHSGSWVGWKRLGDSAAAGGPLFVPSAFYNFLCPQVPDSI